MIPQSILIFVATTVNLYYMAISETKEVLIAGLKIVLTNKDMILAIALLLKSEAQMLTMIDWIYKYQN